MQKIQNVKNIALLLLVLITAALAGALILQYVYGFAPCHLCMLERIPYYFALFFVLPLLLFLSFSIYLPLCRIFFAFIFVLFSADFVLSFYHMGAEYKWWAGPAACSSQHSHLVANTSVLLQSLKRAPDKVACDVAPFYLLNLSPAGWNMLLCLLLMMLAFYGIRTLRGPSL